MRWCPWAWRWAVGRSAQATPPGRLARHWLIRREAVTLFPAGMPCTIGDVTLNVPTGAFDYYSQHFEEAERTAFAALLTPGMIVLDVGANAGYYSLVAARTVARVHAVEPSPRNLPILRANVRHVPNITVHPVAASDRHGQSTWTFAEDGINDSLRDGTPYAATVGHATVTVAPLDDVIQEASVDVIKMDIQGAEPLALRGMHRLLAGSPTVTVLIEWSPPCLAQFGYTAEDLLETLRAAGLNRIEAMIDDRRVSLDDARAHLHTHALAYCNLLARH
jgi:FkbM family methyltransferase